MKSKTRCDLGNGKEAADTKAHELKLLYLITYCGS